MGSCGRGRVASVAWSCSGGKSPRCLFTASAVNQSPREGVQCNRVNHGLDETDHRPPVPCDSPYFQHGDNAENTVNTESEVFQQSGNLRLRVHRVLRANSVLKKSCLQRQCRLQWGLRNRPIAARRAGTGYADIHPTGVRSSQARNCFAALKMTPSRVPNTTSPALTRPVGLQRPERLRLRVHRVLRANSVLKKSCRQRRCRLQWGLRNRPIAARRAGTGDADIHPAGVRSSRARNCFAALAMTPSRVPHTTSPALTRPVGLQRPERLRLRVHRVLRANSVLKKSCRQRRWRLRWSLRNRPIAACRAGTGDADIHPTGVRSSHARNRFAALAMTTSRIPNTTSPALTRPVGLQRPERE